MILQSAHVPSRVHSWRGRSQRSKRCDRSGSITSCPRPRSEVELREESTPRPTELQQCPCDTFEVCAAGLVSALVCDAVDEVLVDDMVHDEDILSDDEDQLCHVMDFPCSTEELNRANHVDCVHAADVMDQSDDVEDVVSFGSESCDELEDMMEEIEEFAYAGMAEKLATDAVNQGCLGTAGMSGHDDEGKHHSARMSGMTQEPKSADVGGQIPEACDTYEAALDGSDNELLDVEADTADDADDSMCEDGIENGFMAFGIVRNIVEVAFSDAIVKWKQQASNTRNEDLELKERARSSRVGPLQLGDVCFGSDLPDASKESVQNVVADCAAHEQLHDTLSQIVIASTTGNAMDEVVKGCSRVQHSPDTPTNVHSARNRRRIIGAIKRAPAADQEQENVFAVSKTSSSTSSARRQHKDHTKTNQHDRSLALVQVAQKTNRKPKLKLPETFNMDLSGCEESTKVRGSSLTRQYDTLGAPIYSLHARDEWQPCLSDMSSSQYSTRCARQQNPTMGVGKLVYERPLSKASARLRAASMSAMAMDLGQVGNDCASPGSVAAEVFSADNIKLLGGATWGACDQKAPLTSSSRASKAKLTHSGLLPPVHSAKMSSQSLACTMKMSKTATKWCVSGLHGSASAVF